MNPLAHWSRQEVWDYLAREGVPYNPLFDKSYASIGDTVTTSTTSDPNNVCFLFFSFLLILSFLLGEYFLLGYLSV